MNNPCYKCSSGEINQCEYTNCPYKFQEWSGDTESKEIKNQSMTNDENYSEESIKYAHKRVDYEMGYIDTMDFTEKQIEYIKEHIYFSVRKAYSDGCADTEKKIQKS